MTHPTIAIIGAGNMGTSLITGLIKNGHSADKLWATDPSSEKLDFLRHSFQIHTTTDNERAAQAADVLIFALKPQIMSAAITALRTTIQTRKPLILSIAAGIRITSLQQWLGEHIAIVRAMPNTPALIGCGATALFANSAVTPLQHSLAESTLRAVGVTVWLTDEKCIDIVTALSGSGPAYFFHMMEALQLAAEELGLPSEPARLLTLQTALGAARMAIESGLSLVELRHRVTSPGGTTEKALSVLDEHHLAQLYKQAMHAAKSRSEELAELLGEKK